MAAATREVVWVRNLQIVQVFTPRKFSSSTAARLRAARAAVLRSRGVEVHEGEEFSGARFLWQPNVYDLVMLDVRRYPPGETLEFCEQIKDASPRQQFAFLMGSPMYLSRTLPGEVAGDDVSRGQWAETVKSFPAAA